MAGYKLTKKDEYYTAVTPGHNECKLCRLHDAGDIDGGSMTVVFAHFLPSGGGTEFVESMETVYYIVHGTVIFKGDDGVETVLEKGDSVHCGPHTNRSVTNIGTDTAQVLVIVVA